MDVDPLHCDATSTVTPPPELLTFSDLEYFLSARRIWPFLLLRARLLDFICTPESVISYELDILEYFPISHTPCISGITSNSYWSSTIINSSHKLRGPNMCTLYQRIWPPQYGKCLLDSSLTRIVDLLARWDQRQGWIVGRELAHLLFSPSRSTVIPHPRSSFIDGWFIEIAGFNLTIVKFDISEPRAPRFLDPGHVDLHITPWP